MKFHTTRRSFDQRIFCCPADVEEWKATLRREGLSPVSGVSGGPRMGLWLTALSSVKASKFLEDVRGPINHTKLLRESGFKFTK